jgi:hypothetical protein
MSWSSGKVATPCSRVALVRVVSQRSNAALADGKSDLRQGGDGRWGRVVGLEGAERSGRQRHCVLKRNDLLLIV